MRKEKKGTGGCPKGTSTLNFTRHGEGNGREAAKPGPFGKNRGKGEKWGGRKEIVAEGQAEIAWPSSCFSREEQKGGQKSGLTATEEKGYSTSTTCCGGKKKTNLYRQQGPQAEREQKDARQQRSNRAQ